MLSFLSFNVIVILSSKILNTDVLNIIGVTLFSHVVIFDIVTVEIYINGKSLL